MHDVVLKSQYCDRMSDCPTVQGGCCYAEPIAYLWEWVRLVWNLKHVQQVSYLIMQGIVLFVDMNMV